MTPLTLPILMDIPMPILTPRLRLEPVRPGLSKIMNEAIIESRESLGAWMPWAIDPDQQSDEARETWLRTEAAKFTLREKLSVMIFHRESGRYLGNTGFHDINWAIPKLTIGYWIRSSEQGQGYATETTLGLLHYAFQVLAANRVEIVHNEKNTASARVIEKAGFTREGILRNFDWGTDGELRNDVFYSHINPQDVPKLDVTWGQT